MPSTRRLTLILVLATLIGSSVHAADLVINTDTTWSEGSHVYDAVTVTAGATLTCEGVVSLQAASLTVDTGAAISADGQGWPGQQGPGAGSSQGGGAHGGAGGGNSSAIGGLAYDSATLPAEKGSGGGGGPYNAQGGAGGGALLLDISGPCTVNGSITANGDLADSPGGWDGGGGAGGTIRLTAASLAGSGIVSADGGPAPINGHGGGGGRIFITAANSTFTGGVSTTAGSSAAGTQVPAEDGTIGFFDSDDNVLTAGSTWRFQAGDGPFVFTDILINSSETGIEPDVSLTTTGTFSVTGSSTVDVYGGHATITVSAHDLLVESGSMITVEAKGWPSEQGPGAGSWMGGGSHGGLGGHAVNSPTGNLYGTALSPTTHGSGGGNGPNGAVGGHGGGTVRLDVENSCTIDGEVSADGESGSNPGVWDGGGGAGGSVFIATDTLSGAGSISADGGPINDRYAGGGGRIAIHFRSSDFTGDIHASGGIATGTGTAGENGTVGLVDTDDDELTTGPTWHFQERDAPFEYNNVTIHGSTILFDEGVGLVARGTIDIDNGSLLTGYGRGDFSITAGELNLAAGCTMDVDLQGWSADQGPGFGQPGAGAGHGGTGGTNGTSQGGAPYGTDVWPVEPGSGGGTGIFTGAGGAGGGVITLTVTDTVTLDGDLTADAGDGDWSGGGGSGGSILVSAGRIEGAGSLTASGGNGGTYGGASGGAGGRIAIRYDEHAFTGSTDIAGGINGSIGEDGTERWVAAVGLQLDTPLELDLLAGPLYDFPIHLSSGQIPHLRVVVTPISGAGPWTLMGRRGSPPDLLTHNWSVSRPTESGEFELLIPSPAAGTIHFSVLHGDGSVPHARMQIEAQTISRHITPSTRGRVPLGSRLPVTLSGLGIENGMTISLRPASGNGLTTAPDDWGPSWLTATFGTSESLEPGPYDLIVRWPDAFEIELPDYLEFVDDSQPMISAWLSGPTVVRPGRWYTMELHYQNISPYTIPAPHFQLHNTQNNRMSVGSSGTPETGTIQILGGTRTLMGSSGKSQLLDDRFEQPGEMMLAPGEGRTVPVSYYPYRGETGDYEFRLGLHLEESLVPIDWVQFAEDIRPDDVTDEIWDRLVPLLQDTIGDTWGDFSTMLRVNATYLDAFGRSVAAHSGLLDLTVGDVLGAGPRRWLAQVVDVSSSSPGLPLAFGRVFPNGLSGRCYLGPLGRGWRHSYDVFAAELTSGDVTVNQNDSSLRRFELRPDGSYNATAVGDRGRLTGVGGGWLLTELDGTALFFDATGRLNEISVLNGHTLYLAYDGSGRLQTVTHTSGESVALTYNGWGRINTLTDHFGRITTFAYDTAGELLMEVVGPGSEITRYDYQPYGGTPDPSDWALLTVELPNGDHQSFEYDSFGRLAAEESDTGEERLIYDYEQIGRTIVTGENLEMTFYRDELGRLARARDALGNCVWLHRDNDGNIGEIVDPSLASWFSSHDHLGFVESTHDPLGRIDRIGHNYPLHGGAVISSIEDAEGNRSLLGHDGLGNLTGITLPDGLEETFTNDAGTLSQYTNRRGQTTEFTFNQLGRLTRRDLPDGSFVTYDYDAFGRLITITDDFGATTIAWDARSMPTRIDYPDGHWVTYEFNDAGQRTRRETDDGTEVEYEYNVAGRLEKVTDGAATEYVRYVYDGLGRLAEEWRANNTSTTYSRDAAGRVLSVVHHAPDTSIQARFDYTYDANSNPTTMTTLDGVTAFDHDDVGQLVGVTYPSGRHVAYSYDAAGNRIQVSDDGAVSDITVNELNQVTVAGSSAFTWNDDGLLATRTDAAGTTTYSWSSDGRLLAVVSPTSGTWSYTYDAFGFVGTVNHDGTTQRFVSDPFGPSRIATRWTGPTFDDAFIDGLGLAARRNGVSDVVYPGFDWSGNARLETGASGQVTATWDIDSFGVINSTTGSSDNPFLFSGRFGVFDHGDGLLHTLARPYDSSLGRFVAPEPLRFLTGANLYLYAGNGPLRWVDPNGFEVWSVENTISTISLWGGEAIDAFAKPGMPLQKIGGPFTAFLSASAGVIEIKNSSHIYGDVHGGGTIALTIAGAVLSGGGTLAASVTAWGSDLLAGAHWEAIQTRVDTQFVPRNPYHVHGPDVHPATVAQWKKFKYKVVDPSDPNEKRTSLGEGPLQMVQPGEELHYSIAFENMPNALAPAQEVWVTDQLAPELDWSTFRLTEVGWGDHQVEIPEDTTTFAAREAVDDYRDDVGKQWWVDVTADPNPATGEIEFTFRTLDPDTGALPADPYAGFLPPNDASGRGDGWIGFAVRTKPDLAEGTEVFNDASIVFDTQPAIITNTVFNTIGYPMCDPTGDGVMDAKDLAEMIRVLTEYGYRPPGFADCDHRDGETIADLLWLVERIHE